MHTGVMSAFEFAQLVLLIVLAGVFVVALPPVVSYARDTPDLWAHNSQLDASHNEPSRHGRS
jgi:hypothetical protein